jgi:hypothetical protein
MRFFLFPERETEEKRGEREKKSQTKATIRKKALFFVPLLPRSLSPLFLLPFLSLPLTLVIRF